MAKLFTLISWFALLLSNNVIEYWFLDNFPLSVFLEVWYY